MGDIKGKIILDTTNPLTRGPDGIALEIGHSISAGEKVQGWAVGASVFKTLNTTGFGNMANPVFNGVKSVMFVAGDDVANKPKVINLVGDLGFEVIDAGPLRNARLLEAHAMLWIDLALVRGQGRDFAFATLKTLRTNIMNAPSTSHYPAAPTAQKPETHTLSVLVDNEPGVLARVIGLFSGRGYNIESLTVSETEHAKHLSLITIVTTGTPMVIEQIKNQLDRLVPVHRVVDMTLLGRSIERELAMVKVQGQRRASGRGAAAGRCLPRPRHRRHHRELYLRDHGGRAARSSNSWR